MKYLKNPLKKIAIAAMLTSLSIGAAPAFAAPGTVSTKPGVAISAVSDSTEITMPAIPGGSIGFEANPDFFRGGQFCVSGLDANWAIKRDGTLDARDPARRASCAPIGANGQVSVSNPFGPSAVPFLIAADGRIYWAGRNRLTGLSN